MGNILAKMRSATIATLVAGCVLATPAALAQTGIKRTDLQRHDLSTPGREAVQVRVDFEPGTAFPNHTHPGEEIIYVLAGTLEYQIEGKPAVTQGRRCPVHTGRNGPCREECRHHQRKRACDLRRRERQTTADAGEVRHGSADSPQNALLHSMVPAALR